MWRTDVSADVSAVAVAAAGGPRRSRRRRTIHHASAPPESSAKGPNQSIQVTGFTGGS